MQLVRTPLAPLFLAAKAKDFPSNRRSKTLGYSARELRAHLQSQFCDGMTWGNHGEWEVDHIRPVSDFDLWKRKIECEVHSLCNLRPVWRAVNQSKGAKV